MRCGVGGERASCRRHGGTCGALGKDNTARDPWEMSLRAEPGPGLKEPQMPCSGFGIRLKFKPQLRGLTSCVTLSK